LVTSNSSVPILSFVGPLLRVSCRAKAPVTSSSANALKCEIKISPLFLNNFPILLLLIFATAASTVLASGNSTKALNDFFVSCA